MLFFASYGHLGTASGVAGGFRPTIAVCELLPLLGALTAHRLKGARTASQLDRSQQAPVRGRKNDTHKQAHPGR